MHTIEVVGAIASLGGFGVDTVGITALCGSIQAHSPLTLAVLWNLGPLEIGVILLLGLLLFGRKLPEVGRNVGRSIIEFKRGLRDVSNEMEAESRRDDERRREESRTQSLSSSDSRTVSQNPQPTPVKGQTATEADS